MAWFLSFGVRDCSEFGDWHLSGRTRHVGDEARQPEAADSLCAFALNLLRALERHAEVRDAGNGIAHEDVVRAHARALEGAEEVEHRVGGVVYASEQHRLARHGHARAHEVRACLSGLGSHLAGAVELRVHPHLAAAGEGSGEIARDARGVDARRARAEANDVHLGEPREGAYEAHHLLVWEDERIAARDENVAHEGMVLHIRNARLQLLVGADDIRLAQKALARAVAAVHEAAVAGHDEHAVGETLLQAVASGRFLLLAEGICTVPVVIQFALVGIHLQGELRATFRKRARIRAGEVGVFVGCVHSPFWRAMRVSAPYILRSLGFSIFPVGLRGTGAKMILRGRL